MALYVQATLQWVSLLAQATRLVSHDTRFLGCLQVHMVGGTVGVVATVLLGPRS